jgi:hypothetical protein
MPKENPCAQGHDIEVWRGIDICMRCEYSTSPLKQAPNEIEGHPI